jgi:hypothetical protein
LVSVQVQPAQITTQQIDFKSIIGMVLPIVVMSWAVVLAIYFIDIAVDMKA